MGIDQEAIKKRVSQIEDDINNMNKMIDDNLQIYDAQDGTQAVKEETGTIKEEDSGEEKIASVSPRQFSEVTADAASTFVKNSMIKEPESEVRDVPAETRPQSEPAKQTEEQVVADSAVTVSNPSSQVAQNNVTFEGKDSAQQPVLKDAQVPLPKEPIASTIVVVEPAAPSDDVPSVKAAGSPKARGEVVSKMKNNNAVDHSTSTAEDFEGQSIHQDSEGAFSSPKERAEPIFLPKNNQPDTSHHAVETPPSTPTTPSLRRPTNPFRVVSVGSTNQDASSRKSSRSSGEKDSSYADTSSNAIKLERRMDYLAKKCSKLQKEVTYLQDMSGQATLSIDDKRKLLDAIKKLQEYLDIKTKEKYELGVQLSRQLRKEINRGENGQFWVGTK